MFEEIINLNFFSFCCQISQGKDPMLLYRRRKLARQGANRGSIDSSSDDFSKQKLKLFKQNAAFYEDRNKLYMGNSSWEAVIIRSGQTNWKKGNHSLRRSSLRT